MIMQDHSSTLLQDLMILPCTKEWTIRLYYKIEHDPSYQVFLKILKDLFIKKTYQKPQDSSWVNNKQDHDKSQE